MLPLSCPGSGLRWCIGELVHQVARLLLEARPLEGKAGQHSLLERLKGGRGVDEDEHKTRGPKYYWISQSDCSSHPLAPKLNRLEVWHGRIKFLPPFLQASYIKLD